MKNKKLFGYGSGYVPQAEAMLEIARKDLPGMIFDFFMEQVLQDAQKQGVDTEDEGAMEAVLEAFEDLSRAWIGEVYAAAQSSNPDGLASVLLP